MAAPVKRDAGLQLGEAERESQEAKALLESAGFQNAVTRLQDQYADAWRNSDPKDDQVRQDAYLMIRALDELVVNLKTAASSAGVVAFNLRRTLRK